MSVSKADWVGIILVIAALGTGAYIRNAEWRDPVMLWTKATILSPKKARPHIALARAYLDRARPGDEAKAIEEAWKACQIRPALLELFKDDKDVNWDVVRGMKDWNR